MSQNKIAFESVNYVYGQDINTLSKTDLMASIKRAKAEIQDLESVGVASTFVNDQIVGLEKAIEQMVARLDA